MLTRVHVGYCACVLSVHTRMCSVFRYITFFCPLNLHNIEFCRRQSGRGIKQNTQKDQIQCSQTKCIHALMLKVEITSGSQTFFMSRTSVAVVLVTVFSMKYHLV